MKHHTSTEMVKKIVRNISWYAFFTFQFHLIVTLTGMSVKFENIFFTSKNKQIEINIFLKINSLSTLKNYTDFNSRTIKNWLIIRIVTKDITFVKKTL